MNIELVESDTPSRLHQVNFENLRFGVDFSDHMLSCRHEHGAWQTARIIPYEDLRFQPSMVALHYGQSVFEGMKAYYKNDTTIQLFRPLDHYRRLVNSCVRMCIPPPPEEIFMEGLRQLLTLDREWVPKTDGGSLYIRPLVFGSDEMIMAKSSESFEFLIMTSPVGPYYHQGGIKPLSLTTAPEYVRAVVGGTGEAKTAGNYAASFKPAAEVQKKGFAQVMWLDAVERRYIEEVGTMNLFFKFRDRLATPSLTGSVLPGITRRSVIELAREEGVVVSEERLSVDALFEAHERGELEEVFGAGTAAVIAPVDHIHHLGRSIRLDVEEMGPFARRMYDQITGIQYGRIEDRFGWTHPVDTTVAV